MVKNTSTRFSAVRRDRPGGNRSRSHTAGSADGGPVMLPT